MKKHAELLRDSRTYMRSIGKEDDGRRRMYNVLERDGRDTIVRVCFSVPDRNPPVRALGYFAAATRTVQEYLPEAQLQFIATVHANARINQVPLEEAKAGARQLFDAAVSIKGITPHPETDVVYGFDTPTLPEVPMHRIIPIMRHEEVSKELAKSAARRGTRYEEYVGAHLALHDAVDVVESARAYGSVPVSEAETIVSIGAESERRFYLARHICRSALYFTFPGMVEDTAQLFTRHVYPPYAYLRHNTEGMFDPALMSPDSVRQLGSMALDPILPLTSIQRDLLYVREQIEGMEDND
jgi:hypothetical protein